MLTSSIVVRLVTPLGRLVHHVLRLQLHDMIQNTAFMDSQTHDQSKHT